MYEILDEEKMTYMTEKSAQKKGGVAFSPGSAYAESDSELGL